MHILTDVEKRLEQLGFFNSSVRNANVGESDYSKHIIQPWSIWQDYNLDPWDADIVKRVLRTKKVEGKTAEESRIEDYKKIIHICKEKLRQLNYQGADIKESSKNQVIKLNSYETDRLFYFLKDVLSESGLIITQEPNGVGIVTKAKLGDKEQDITDYGAW